MLLSKPHIARYFIHPRIGWGWGVWGSITHYRIGEPPAHTVMSFRTLQYYWPGPHP